MQYFITKTINKKRILRGIFMLTMILTIGFGMSFASTGNTGAGTENRNISLSETLSNKKVALETIVANTYQNLYNNYETEIAPLTNTPNFQALMCLNLMKNTNILSTMDIEIETIRSNLLKEYVTINAEIFNLMNQYAVGLLNDIIYTTEKQRLTLKVENFSSTYQALLEQFYTRYNSQINIFKQEIKNYNDQNNELLKWLNNKLIAIEEILGLEQIMQEGMFKMNNTLNIQEEGFYKELENARSYSIDKISAELDEIIDKYASSYPEITNIRSIFNWEKNNIINLFSYDIDTQIRELFGNRYNRDNYLQLEEQIDLLKDMFYEDGQLICSKILTTSLDLDGYMDNMKSTTQTMIQSIDNGLNMVSQTGAGLQIRKDLIESFQNFHTTRLEKDAGDFKNYVIKYLTSKSPKALAEQEAMLQNKLKSISHKRDNITFDRGYERWANDKNIKILQELLNKLWRYHGPIDGIYNAATADAVYELQMNGNLLGNQGNKHPAAGWMGPSTRAYAMEKLQAIITEEKMKITKTNDINFYRSPNETTEINPLLPLIEKIEKKFETKEQFITVMQRGLNMIDLRINHPSISTQDKFRLQRFKTAVQLYLNENQ